MIKIRLYLIFLLLLPLSLHGANIKHHLFFSDPDVNVGDLGSGFDCYSRFPLGRFLGEEETGSYPPLQIIIGNIKSGVIKYHQGRPLRVEINYSREEIESFFVKAEALFHERPVGRWELLEGSGEVDPGSCSKHRDTLIGKNIRGKGKDNVVAYWIPSSDVEGYVEFQLTVVGKKTKEDGKRKFWITNSFLVDASK